jgi:hypothetical protein
VDIAISTTFRQPLYVHEMLESMYLSDRASDFPLRFVVCGTDESYLGNWLARGSAEVCQPDQWRAQFEDIPPQGRCTLNFQRVLGGGDGALLALEDDVAFTSDWVDKLDRALQSVDRRRGPKRRRDAFVLALYAALRFKRQPVAEYNPMHFYGNQALYFSPDARVRLRRFITQELTAGRPQPADMFVKTGARERLYDLLVVNPNLCQHIGTASSLSLREHRSPSFKP